MTVSFLSADAAMLAKVKITSVNTVRPWNAPPPRRERTPEPTSGDQVQLSFEGPKTLERLEIPARFSMFLPLDPSLGTLHCPDVSTLKARAQAMQAQGTALIAVRHGESQANAAGGGALLSGRGDSPLTDQGRAQARAAAESLFAQYGESWLAGERSPALYASPLSRAYDTAVALQELLSERGLSVTIQSDADLQEIDFGRCEGRNAREVSQQYPNFGRGTDFRHRFPGGEAGLDVMARVDRFLDRAATHPGQDVIFFGHTMTVGIARMLLGEVDQNDQGQVRIDRSKIPNAAPLVLVAPPARTPADAFDGYILR